jgi:hypothetical protein
VRGKLNKQIKNMLPDYEIELGRGIGNIIFGIPSKELAEILGAPNETDYPEDPERIDWETYNYNTINCSFSFDPGQEDRLIEISVENGYFHIGRKIRVGVRKEELLILGTGLKLGECIIEDRKTEENPAQVIISYPRAGLHFWLDNDIITAIKISPLLNEDGSIIWPERAGDEMR